MARTSLRCDACNRTFTLPAHLARHMSAIHGKRRKANGRRGRPPMSRRAGRPPASRVGRPRKIGGYRRMKGRVGRAPSVAGVMKLARMSLEQLGSLIDAARVEARRRLSELTATFS